MRSGFSPPAWIDDAARAVYESCWRFHDSSNATPDPVHGVPFGECARRGWEEVRGTAAGWCYYAANALALSSPSAEQLSELSDWAVGVAEGRGEDLFDTGHSRPFFALVEEVKRKVAAALVETIAEPSPPEGPLAVSEVACAKVLAVMVEWPVLKPVPATGGATDTLHLVHAALYHGGLMGFTGATNAGVALLDRARRGGSLGAREFDRSTPPLDPADMAAVKAIGERNRVAASNVKARGVAQ